MTSHECSICEYESGCFRPLKFLHRLFRICQQGRIRRGMRQTARDQARLPPDTVEGVDGKQIPANEDNYANPDSKNFDPDFAAHDPDSEVR